MRGAARREPGGLRPEPEGGTGQAEGPVSAEAPRQEQCGLTQEVGAQPSGRWGSWAGAGSPLHMLWTSAFISRQQERIRLTI